MEQPPPAQTPSTPDPGPMAGWTPPLPPAPPAPPAPLVRPGAVTGAAVVMIVIGVLVTLLGLLFVLFGTLLTGAANSTFSDQFGNLAGAVGGVVAVFGGIVAAFGILEVFSGIYVLPGRSWARITAIILSVLGGLVSLGGVVGGRGANSGIVFPLIFLVAYAFVIWALSVNGRWFAAR